MAERVVSLVDVDNTLLDNDAAKVEIGRRLGVLLGETGTAAFWVAYEAVRAELGVVDIPRAIHRALPPGSTMDQRVALADLFMRFPFADYIYPGALETITWLKAAGPVVILSDGDPVFQPNKINRAGLAAAVDGHVLVYTHKEEHLIEIGAAFPADRYLLIDDKPKVIERVTARAGELGAPLQTVLVRQGKYAAAVAEGDFPAATWTCSTIADVRSVPII
jgi:hypothetical protein